MSTLASEVRSDPLFHSLAVLIFLASAGGTVLWCVPMNAMPGMEMPGGWTMSMTWMRMPEQTWLGHFAMFQGMWTLMMLAMMMPVMLPTFARCRRQFEARRRTQLTVLFGTAYFSMWALAGVALYAIGIGVARWAMQSAAIAQGMPLAAAVMVTLAGVLQLSSWKRRQLSRCDHAHACAAPQSRELRSAWRQGTRLGADCVRCCAPQTAVLLVIGVMDVSAMGWVAASIALERLAPRGGQLARIVGSVMLAAGCVAVVEELLV